MTSPAKASVISSAAWHCKGINTAAISMVRRRGERGSRNEVIMILVQVFDRVGTV